MTSFDSTWNAQTILFKYIIAKRNLSTSDTHDQVSNWTHIHRRSSEQDVHPSLLPPQNQSLDQKLELSSFSSRRSGFRQAIKWCQNEWVELETSLREWRSPLQEVRRILGELANINSNLGGACMLIMLLSSTLNPNCCRCKGLALLIQFCGRSIASSDSGHLNSYKKITLLIG